MLETLTQRFEDPRLEAAFRRRHAKHAARSVALVSFIGAVAVSTFGFLDLTAGERRLPLLVIRYGFMVPLLLGAAALALQPVFRRRVDSMAGMVLAAVASAEASYALWSDAGQILVYQTGLFLILVGGYACTRIRWIPAAVGGLTASVVDVVFLAFVELELWQRGSLLVYLATANALGILVAWQQERTARLLFLDTREIRGQRNELARLNRRLREQALTDPLTGLPNRRAMETCLEEAIAEARRGRPGGSLVLLDLDGFKAINDRLGHGAGDELLRDVAALFRHGLRPRDRAFRIGGDELLLYFPDAAVTDAQRIVERFQEALAEKTAVLELPVGFSAGCTTVRDTDVSPDDALARADALLYLAKANGKSRVIADGRRRGRETAPAG